MTIKQEMSGVLRRAPKLLPENACLRAIDFLADKQTGEGVYQNRFGKADLYYTVFGIESSIALGAALASQKPLHDFLTRHEAGDALDFVHLTCLIRLWSHIEELPERIPFRDRLRDNLETYRAQNGGYHQSGDAEKGSAYGAFLALGALQDLGARLVDSAGITASLTELHTPDGGFSNTPGCKNGSAPATAAALTVLSALHAPVPTETAAWLTEQFQPGGGCTAAPMAPIPDLLSTATALYALNRIGEPLAGLRTQCIAFIDTLWSTKGAFYGHAADTALDCEYLFYGLLALGSLAGRPDDHGTS